jgi:ppGpp synthetase/RelA/SpoT-type nucleotidyltranferase
MTRAVRTLRRILFAQPPPVKKNYHHLKDKINMSHLSQYFDWHKDAAARFKLISDWNYPFGFHHEETIGSVPVHLVGLNTSLLSCDDDDERNLVVDVATVNQALSKCEGKKGLIIVVGHHPIEWLADWNQQSVSRILSQERGAHIYLHGHLHEQLGVFRNDSLGQGLAPLAAGAAYQGSKWPQFFAFYRIDLGNKEIQSTAYKYSTDSGTWLHDPARSRPIVARLPRVPLVTDPAERRGHRRPGADGGGRIDTINNRKMIEEEAHKLEAAAHSAKRWIDGFLNRTHRICDACFAIESLVKQPKQVIQKVESARARSISYGPEHVDDLLRIRLITLYQDDIQKVVGLLLDEVREPRSDKSPFIADRPVEVSIFASRADGDAVAAEVRDVVQASGVPVTLGGGSRPAGYSSVQLTTTCRTGLDDGGLRELRVKFEIGSALQEIWGQIDGRLRYGAPDGDGAHVSWSRYLSVFKTLVDGCIQYAELLRRQTTEEAPTPPDAAREAKPVQPDTIELARLRFLPKELFEQLESAYQRMKEAQNLRQSPGAAGRFRRAADEFRRFCDDLDGRTDVADDSVDKAHHVARMERAYLLMLTGDEGDLAEARGIFETILDPSDRRSRPDDPAALLRLGQLTLRQEQYLDAIAHLERAKDLVETAVDQRVWRSHWIYDSIRLTLAKAHWRLFEDQRKPKDERLAEIQTAIRFAKHTMDHGAASDQKLRSVNDLLYYAWEERNLLRGQETPATVSIELIAALRDELRVAIEARPDANYEHLDTLARAFEFCDDNDGARSIAVRVRDTLQLVVQQRTGKEPTHRAGTLAWYEELRAHLDKDEADALRYASDLLSLNPVQ